MLKSAPKRITAVILSIFTLGLMGQHILFSWKTNADSAEPFELQSRIDKRIPFLPWLERADYDFHLTKHAAGEKNLGVAVISINEPTIQRIGQFPFSRTEYARLIRKLEAVGAKAVGFDITFPEVERNDALVELQSLQSKLGVSSAAQILQNRMKDLDGDKNLAEVLRSAKIPVILGMAFTSMDEKNSGLKTISEKVKQLTRDHTLSTVQVNGFAYASSKSGNIPIFPHEKLLDGAQKMSLGTFHVVPDADSSIRTSPIVMEYDNGYYPALSLATVSRALNVYPKLYREDGLVVRDETGKIQIPLDPKGEVLVNYYGGAHEFNYYEFIDVLDGKYDAELKDKILFLGVTAVGLKDIRANPFTADYPGVEVHATLASNILNHSFIVKDQRFYWIGYFLLLVVGALISYSVYRFHPAWAIVIAISSIVVVQFATQKLFFDRGVVVPTFIPSLEYLLLVFSGILYRYFTQEKEKKFVREAFSRYVSGAVVEEILRDQSKLALGGQKKDLTVLFCDMKGFTKLSEGMDAQFLTQFLNQFFTRMTTIILRNQGTLDKYMGDAIMCFWGAPLDLSNHAELACKTALEMCQELKEINKEWKVKYGFEIGIRVGINTGEMFVGNMGSDQVFSYTVLGDSVNLGSRLESVNTSYGTSILVSRSTAAHANGFAFRSLDLVQVKGREEPVEIYELMDEPMSAEWIQAFEQGRKLYTEKRWDEAEAAFGTCLALKNNDGPSKVFLDRIAILKKTSPPDFNGVWRLRTK